MLTWSCVTRLPKLSPASASGQPAKGGARRGLSRRATLRPEIRAALALEEAGELQEAARIFEYAGEHGQAALLRLEHARTLRDPDDRIAVLREGCARNSGTTPEGRTLHLALAEALLTQAEAVEDAARRRGLELEAARTLEEADASTRAGELYESLGLLRRAANAYERGGDIARLELILEVLERHEQRVAAARALIREIDEATALGRRRYAQELLREHTGVGRNAVGDSDRPPPAELLSRLQLLGARLVGRDRVELRWGSGRVTAVRGAPRFGIGRAPDNALSLPAARLSRHHVELRVDAPTGHPKLVAVDLGSRVGTFWRGEPLAPGEPMALETAGELGLGATTAVEIHPVTASSGEVQGGLCRPVGTQLWSLFVPAGGPLWLAPDIRVPARILFDRGYAVLDLPRGVSAHLGDTPLPPASRIELMVGDRITLVGAPLTMEVLG